MTDRRGTLLGKYRLLERLGEGGMGTVYRARDEMLDRDVAIKVLRPDLVRQTALVERFRTEAIALARLAHPRIATLFGLERDGDEFYMVMEFLRGETLEALVAREGRIPWRRAAEICAQVAEALDHAHDHGVVHRDIKPANIMIGAGDATKVMDFGIARMAGSSRQTRHGHSVGTPAYMAPEQLRGEECDGRTDLYALGAVFYELVTGKVAFEADSDYKLMMQQLNDPPLPPSVSNPEVPSIVDRAVLRAMSKRPADRFATASAMRNALMEAAAAVVTAESAAARPAAPATRLATPTPPPQEPERAHHINETAPLEVPRHPTPADSPPDVSRNIWLDWRTWTTVAMLALAVAFVVRSMRPNLPTDDSTAVATDHTPPTNPVRPVPSQTPSPGTVPVTSAVPPEQRRGGTGEAPPPVVGPRRTPPRPGPPSTPKPRERVEPEAPPARVPSPGAEAPPAARSTADDERAVAALVQRWFRQGDGMGLSGTVNGQPAARLYEEKRLELKASGAPAISVQGDNATAEVTGDAAVRSAFGGSKRSSARLTFHLSRSGEGTWRITRVTVQG